MGNKAQKEIDSTPEGLCCLSQSYEEGLIGDLVMAAQGTALLLIASSGNVKGDEWDSVANGIAVTLRTIVNQLEKDGA